MPPQRPGAIGAQPRPTIKRLCYRGADPLFRPAEVRENPREHPRERLWCSQPHFRTGAKRFVPRKMKAHYLRPAGGPFVATRTAISRRSFLRGAGILLSLPLLEAMQPAFAGLAAKAAGLDSTGKPRRMFAICNNLGVLPEFFFPAQKGPKYALSPYLEILREHRNDFTVFSGVSHPDVDGGHPADNCFLTAAPHPGRGNFLNTISLDQYIGERIGHLTRFPSLTLGVNVQQGLRSLSWTGSGVLIPCEEK